MLDDCIFFYEILVPITFLFLLEWQVFFNLKLFLGESWLYNTSIDYLLRIDGASGTLI